MGIGEKLVSYILDYSKSRNFQFVSIGIIADHTELKNWYLKLGFTEKETMEFDHLPFKVCYLMYYL